VGCVRRVFTFDVAGSAEFVTEFVGCERLAFTRPFPFTFASAFPCSSSLFFSCFPFLLFFPPVKSAFPLTFALAEEEEEEGFDVAGSPERSEREVDVLQHRDDVLHVLHQLE
jgi:hypothetical protein